MIEGGPLVGLFEEGKSLLRALVAAEVLGPPRALDEEQNRWSQPPPPSEPSTSPR